MDARKKGTVIYFLPVEQWYIAKWEYYQVDLDMLEASFNNVVLCKNTLSCIKTLVAHNADAIYCWWWHRSAILVVLARLMRIPVFVTGAVHMYDESGAPDFSSKGVLFRIACRFAWRFASVNLFISKSQYRQICSHEVVNNPQLLRSSLPKNYKHANTRPSQKAETGKLIDEKISILTIVWMTHEQLKRKSVYETLEGISLLVERGVKNFEWVIAGGAGDGQEDLVSRIAALKLQPYVKVVCDISEEEKAFLFKSADLYIQPSYYEGFGNAVLEAMSYGLVAVVSRNTAQAEVVGDSGYIVEEIEPSFIADALQEFLSLSCERQLERRARVIETVKERHLFEYRLDGFAHISASLFEY